MLSSFCKIEPRSPQERSLLLRASVVAALLFVLDQITKAVVVAYIEFGTQITIIPKIFNLTYITNKGAAWGILHGKAYLLLIISVVFFLFIIIFLRRLCDGWSERYWAFMLILSGIVGNTMDRVFRGGEVVDFLQFYFLNIKYQWPSFNVADSCITIGVLIFVISTLFRPEHKKNESPKNDVTETT